MYYEKIKGKPVYKRRGVFIIEIWYSFVSSNKTFTTEISYLLEIRCWLVKANDIDHTKLNAVKRWNLFPTHYIYIDAIIM